jgi:hypothetical protein
MSPFQSLLVLALVSGVVYGALSTVVQWLVSGTVSKLVLEEAAYWFC